MELFGRIKGRLSYGMMCYRYGIIADTMYLYAVLYCRPLLTTS
jgi:hypothetical protein